MRKFIKNSVIGFIGIILFLFLIEIVYSKIYNSAAPRNKTQYILSLKKGEKIDYVFLGSSRVENFIVPSLINKLTGKKALNLGTQGARLDDVNIFLRLLISKKIKIKKLFVQVDYIYNFESNSDIVRSQSLPFIRSNSIIKNYLKRTDSNFHKNYYFPFYRYAVNDYRLGFREFVASALNKKSKINFEDGYVPVFGSIKEGDQVSSNLPEKIIESNKSFTQIDSLCKANTIDVIYFCSPFCSRIQTNNYLSKLEKKIPNFENFSSAVKQDSLFGNCSHLNKEGAYQFTRYLVKTLNL